MNIKNTMLKMTTVIAVVFSFVACEDDFETVGGNIIGEPGFNAELYDEAEISAYTNTLAPVQTNNLPVNLLGHFTDPVFGDQVASIYTQLSLGATSPEFGTDPVLDSVVLNIPYFSTELENDADGNAQYKIDSLYGEGPIKLSVLESSFFLNNFDPETNFEQAQKYYSDLGTQIEENLTGAVLYVNESFEPSAEEIVEITSTDTTRTGPALRIKLDNAFFQTKILNKEGSDVLASQNSFRNYLRGIYLKAEKIGADGSMVIFNMAQANAGITMYYTVKEADVDDIDEDEDKDELVDTPKSFKLSFGSSKVNTFEQNTPQFPESSNLYLKGGKGSMAVIELFSGLDSNDDGISDELEFLRENNWLINEANLEFYVNNELASGLNQPERVLIYDLNTNAVLVDYVFNTPGTPNPLNSPANNNHLVPLKTDENGNGVVYKVRITKHVNNILNNDVDNPKLGLVVTQNVNILSNSAVKQTEESVVKRVPAGSVITPEATVLYGPDAEDDAKRLKLKIYYTESK